MRFAAQSRGISSACLLSRQRPEDGSGQLRLVPTPSCQRQDRIAVRGEEEEEEEEDLFVFNDTILKRLPLQLEALAIITVAGDALLS